MFGTFPTRSPKYILLLLLSCILILTACNATPVAQEKVSFTTNIGAEFIGHSLSFQYPRNLEVGYWSDSGAYGWLIADADPNKVFWASNQTGEEMVILMVLQQNDGDNSDFAQLVEEMKNDLPPIASVEEFTQDEKQVAYFIGTGEAGGIVVTPEVVLWISGNFPPEKEDIARSAVETVLRTARFPKVDDPESLNYSVWGTRDEGPLEKGEILEGYLPVCSESSWKFNQDSGNTVTLSIDTGDVESVLWVDILDLTGNSVLSAGKFEVSRNLINQSIDLPGEGTYNLLIQAGSSSCWYGWYQIQLDAATAGDSSAPFATRTAAQPPTATIPPPAAVTSVAWSPEGLLAAGADNGTVSIWDTRTGELVQTLAEHSLVNSVAWSTDGRLAAGGVAGKVIVWEASSGKVFQVPTGSYRRILSVAWSQDGWLAAGVDDGSILLWDSELGEVVQTLTKFGGYINSVAWSPVGRLASGSGEVILWDKESLESGEAAQILKGPTGFIQSVAWSRNGLLASGSNNEINVWNLESGEVVQTLSGDGKAVWSVAWSADGQLASGSVSNQVIVWNLERGMPAQTLTGHSGNITSVAWSTDGQLASGSFDGIVIVWNLENGHPDQTFSP